ncbi:MAG: DNA-3-methyladenine glycosylase 2 family protein [Acidaminococcaceae bacterium]|nr:DNA-3-methyladenine glycosylase 2 family protein [Acidaminococcaceae bacterium]
MDLYFNYGEKELAYLKAKDKKLAAVIEKIGYIERKVDSDMFSSVIHHIIGQQISTAAQRSVWNRLCSKLGAVEADGILLLGREELRSVGMSYKKAEYISDFAAKIKDGVFDISSLETLDDAAVVKELTSLKGVGVWTAEMLLIFCLQRPDVVSYGDLGILRGLRMLYRHKKIDREKFLRYRKRYSPYGTVASFYLWAVAGGAIPELTDPASTKSGKREV